MNKFFSTLTLTTATTLAVALTGTAISNHLALGQTSIDLAKFRSAALSAHNTYRAKHSSPNMTLSDSLNSSAQAWADKIAASGEFEHSTSNDGENLFVASYQQIDPTSLANNAVKDWYEEIKNYNFDNPQFSDETGHFTQVVWKGSTQLGCGAAQRTGKRSNAFYVVCQYAPAGNVTGEFADNVLKPQ